MTALPRLRVLLLGDWFVYYLASLANGLALSADVTVVIRTGGAELGVPGPGCERKRELFSEDVNVLFIPGGPLSTKGVRALATARRVVSNFRPDIVHAQAHADWRLLSLASSLPRSRRVLTVHDVIPHPGDLTHSHVYKRIVRKGLYRSSGTIVLHGNVLKELFRRESDVPPDTRLAVIPHGVIQHPVGSALLPDVPVALFFGRIVYYKGLDVFIQAVEKAAQTVPGLRGLIAGTGPDKDRCVRYMTRPELFEWRDEFIPDRDLPDLFARASVTVLPYREGSQSGVIPTSFANARPVIATNVGALAEAVRDSVDGYVVEPSVASISDALVRAFQDAGVLEEMSLAAHSRAMTGDLSPGQITGRHLRLYKELLSAPVAARTLVTKEILPR